MNNASKMVYVSQVKLDRYTEERAKQQQRILEGIPEEEVKDEVHSSEGEEQIQQVVKKPQEIYRARRLSVCDNLSDEDVNSDELGDQIEGTRQTA